MTVAGEDRVEIEAHGAAEVLVTGPEILCKWREACRIEVPGRDYSRPYQQHVRAADRLRAQGLEHEEAERLAGGWDGTWAPGSWCRVRSPESANIDATYELKCSRGVVPRLLEDLGYSPLLAEHIHGAPALSPALYAQQQPRWKDLRDYQQEAFLKVADHGWGRIAFATNAGKGAVIALLADYAWMQSVPVLILCDEIAVFDALLGELRTWADIDPYLVRAKTAAEPPPPGITLAMLPSLRKRCEQEPELWKAWLKTQGMLLLDEADKATADTWRALCRATKATRWRAGFSGTFPQTRSYEDWLLEDLMGPVLLSARNKELVDRGISARPTVEMHGFDASRGLFPLPSWEDWRAASGPGRRLWAFENAIVRNEERHAFLRSLIRPDTPTAIIVNRIEHGELLEAFLPDSVFLDGGATEARRDLALDAFRDGTFRILIVTKILDRGTNRLGHAQDVIFASGEGSTRQTLQRIGRGLRRADGKATLRLVDIIDHVRVDGHDDRRVIKAAGFLHEAGRTRVELYTAEDFDIEVIP